MINVSTEQLRIITDIIGKYVPDCEVRAFGSRYKRTNKDYSDLDIAIVGEKKLDWKLLMDMREAFEESELPFRVDVLDWHGISPEFQEVIEQGYEVIYNPSRDHSLTQIEKSKSIARAEGIEGWREVRLGEVCEITSSKRIFANEYKDDGIPFFRGKEIIEKHNGEDISTELFISDDKYNEIKSKFGVPQKGDILLTSVGTIGVPFVVNDEQFYFKDGNITWLRNFDRRCYGCFIYYWLLSNQGKHQIEISTIGSTQKALTIDALKKIDITLPTLSEQKAIAAVLSALDDKIEVNKQINKKLEELAQAIFKSWFVDFEPFQDGEFEDSELGRIPKGWKFESLEEASLDIICGKTPSTRDNENYGSDLPFITIPDMHKKVFVTTSERFLSTKGAKSQTNKTLPANCICVSCIATPGLVSINAYPSQTNQQINSIICKEPNDLYYLFIAMKRKSIDIINLGSGGSATLNLNKTEFSKIMILIPPKETRNNFTELVKPSFDYILRDQVENESLEMMRDTLLPKLMSGKIRI